MQIFQKNRLKLTFPIHGPGNSSDNCKILINFGSKYAKSRPNKELRQDPANKNKVEIQQDNNYIVQHAVDEIILQEKNAKCKYETHENIDSEVDEYDL